MTFRVKRIKRERGLSRARKSRKHDELVARDRKIYIFKIVFACSANNYFFKHIKKLFLLTELTDTVTQIRRLLKFEMTRGVLHFLFHTLDKRFPFFLCRLFASSSPRKVKKSMAK